MVRTRREEAEQRGTESNPRGHLADHARLPKLLEGCGEQVREADNDCNLEKKQTVIEHCPAPMRGAIRNCELFRRGLSMGNAGREARHGNRGKGGNLR